LSVYGVVVGVATLGTGVGQGAPLASRIAALLVVGLIFLPALAFVREVAARRPRLPRLPLALVAGVSSVAWALILVAAAILGRKVGFSLADFGPALLIIGGAGTGFGLLAFDERAPRPGRWWRSTAIGVAALDLILAAVVVWGGPTAALAA
jgi:hypothetical protein